LNWIIFIGFRLQGFNQSWRIYFFIFSCVCNRVNYLTMFSVIDPLSSFPFNKCMPTKICLPAYTLFTQPDGQDQA